MKHTAELYLFWGAFAPTLSLDQLLSGNEDADEVVFDIADTGPLPDEMIARTDVRRAVRNFVSNLTPREQTIVREVFWDDQTQTQVAAKLNISKMAISKALARVCKQGRAVLATYGNIVPAT